MHFQQYIDNRGSNLIMIKYIRDLYSSGFTVLVHILHSGYLPVQEEKRN